MLSDQAVVAESQLNWARMRIEEKKKRWTELG